MSGKGNKTGGGGNGTVIGTEPTALPDKKAKTANKSAKQVDLDAQGYSTAATGGGMFPSKKGLQNKSTVSFRNEGPDNSNVSLQGPATPDNPVVSFNGHPDDPWRSEFATPPRAFAVATGHRSGIYRDHNVILGNLGANTSSEKFIEYYATKVNSELSMPPGLTAEDVREAIKAVEQSYEELQASADTLPKKAARYRQRATAPITRKRLEVFQTIDDLAQINPALPGFVQELLLKQFGKGELDLMHMITNAFTKENFFAGNSMDPHGRRRMGMVLEMLRGLEFFGPLSVQQDGNKFSINNGETKLVSGEVNKETSSMTFRLDPDCPKEHLDQALIAMADMVASHRQTRDNRVTITKASDPAITIRYCELLLCKHKMHLDISPEVAESMRAKVANDPELQERWDFILRFHDVFSNKTGNKLARAPSSSPPLDDYGFDSSQYLRKVGSVSSAMDSVGMGFAAPKITEHQLNSGNYRACLEFLFQQRLRGDFSSAAPSMQPANNSGVGTGTFTPNQQPQPTNDAKATFKPPGRH